MNRRLGAVAVAAALALPLAACGGDDGEAGSFDPSTVPPEDVTSSTTTTTTAAPPPASDTTMPGDGAELPPAGALELEPIYGEQLAALGLELTDRGGLIDRTGGGYEPSAEGRHLALYVQPTTDRTMPQYIDGILSVSALFADVFERWPGLESFDVCQEPVPEGEPSGEYGGGGEPLPVTQIELTRAEAEAIDFDAATVVDLVRLSLLDPPQMAVRVSSAVANDPAYQAIVAEASR